MKNCTACNQQIAVNVKFCPECGAKQEIEQVVEVPKVENVQHVEEATVAPTEKKHPPILHKILYLVAFLGPLHVVMVSLFYLVFGTIVNGKYSFLYIVVAIVWSLASIGTFVGIVWMMKKRKKGLRMYTINQIIYCIAAVSLAVKVYLEPKVSGFDDAIIVLLVIPAIIFLVLFWTKKFRKYLS